MDSLKLSSANCIAKYQLQHTQDAQQPTFLTLAPSGATKTTPRQDLNFHCYSTKSWKYSTRYFLLLKVKTLLLPQVFSESRYKFSIDSISDKLMSPLLNIQIINPSTLYDFKLRRYILIICPMIRNVTFRRTHFPVTTYLYEVGG